MANNSDLSMIRPRVLIVSRRTVRKNKFVDFVEFHQDLIVNYGAVPVIVPRVSGVHMLLESFQPIHGVVLCEGEDIDPSLYDAELSGFSPEELEEIRKAIANAIELRLAKLCLERNIPCLGICRGSQVLNVACGGTLYQDVEKELAKKIPEEERVMHINYEDYDGHRHPVKVVENSPLHQWFKDSLQEKKMEIMVNSYHRQGVKKLAQRFVLMAFAPDGLVEGFYDPDAYNPEEGKFIMGLQFHPERMRHQDSDDFDCPGCPAAYKLPHSNQELETKRKTIVRSFSIARNLYNSGRSIVLGQESELEIGAEFLEAKTAYSEKLKMNEERERVARIIMGKMSIGQLSDLFSFYHMMEKICSVALEMKIQDEVEL
ncbi:hypothetical protein P3X46_022998 [Hevea brasiliensis]|uniref:Glutamine amidotransferase domain-containing protein n=1 Tax=Hevea brasiliensis TaxID=3981 RepID=A0ABQ9LCA8_HEVBR|nr:hypothetical protein P3X46_022998 [Hevea brasiliensis]